MSSSLPMVSQAPSRSSTVRSGAKKKPRSRPGLSDHRRNRTVSRFLRSELGARASPIWGLPQEGHHAGHDQEHGATGEREGARALKGHHPPHPFAATHLKPMAYTHHPDVR